jgi:hypothetical protein
MEMSEWSNVKSFINVWLSRYKEFYSCTNTSTMLHTHVIQGWYNRPNSSRQIKWTVSPHTMNKKNTKHTEIQEKAEWIRVNESYTVTTLSPIGVADSGYFPLDRSSTNTTDADTPSLSLHDVDGSHVRNSRHSMSSETLCVRKICS